MDSKTTIRWCAMREKALDALAEAERQLDNMASLALTRPGVLNHLSRAGEAVSVAKSRLQTAKVVAISQEAA